MTDGQKTHEKMLNITDHHEMQIKTTMRYQLTPVKMAKIKNTRNKHKDLVARMWRKMNPFAMLVECNLVQLLWKTV